MNSSPRCSLSSPISLLPVSPQQVPRQRTTVLIMLGVADLACFALGNMHYGETWSWLGVIGLLLFLLLFEVL